jgi:hypothetical protein
VVIRGNGADSACVGRQYVASRDAVLFAIDAGGHMLVDEPRHDDDVDEGERPAKRQKRERATASPLLAALRAILSLMKAKIVRNPKDMVGILVFNTELANRVGDQEFAHTYVLQDTLELDAPTIQALKALIQGACLRRVSQDLRPSGCAAARVRAQMPRRTRAC